MKYLHIEIENNQFHCLQKITESYANFKVNQTNIVLKPLNRMFWAEGQTNNKDCSKSIDVLDVVETSNYWNIYKSWNSQWKLWGKQKINVHCIFQFYLYAQNWNIASMFVSLTVVPALLIQSANSKNLHWKSSNDILFILEKKQCKLMRHSSGDQ